MTNVVNIFLLSAFKPQFDSLVFKMRSIIKQNKCIALEGRKASICRDCLRQEIEDWLKMRKPKLVPALKKQEEIFFKNYDYTTHNACSICFKKDNACGFCFRQYIRGWIRNKCPRLLAEFGLFFDFNEL